MEKEAEKTVKERMWEELIEMDKETPIEAVPMSKRMGCSLSYIGSTLRYAFESDFLRFDENGNYLIKNIPDYKEFSKKINEKYTQYRRLTKGTGPRRTSRVRIPEDFKISEENIVPVIISILKENKELKEKLEKTIAYAKKIKRERDEMLISEID